MKSDDKYQKLKLENKHCKKKRLLQVKNNTDSLTNKIEFSTKLVLYQKTKLIIKEEETKWSNTLTKLDRLRSEKGQFDKPRRRVIENIIHNFSSYKLSSSEEYAL